MKTCNKAHWNRALELPNSDAAQRQTITLPLTLIHWLSWLLLPPVLFALLVNLNIILLVLLVFLVGRNRYH